MLRLVRGRLRAIWLRYLGASLGCKVTLGKATRIDYPNQVHFGERATTEADVWVKIASPSARVSVGAFAFLGRGVEIDCVLKVQIGDRTLIAPGVFITDHNHRFIGTERISDQGCDAESVVIGDDVWIGAHATVLPGVTIGQGAVVGAGAVVTKSIPEFEIWAGVPARRIRSRLHVDGSLAPRPSPINE